MRLKQFGNNYYDFMDYASQAYSGDNLKAIRLIAEQFTQIYYEKYVDTSLMSGISLKAIYNNSELLFNALNHSIGIISDCAVYGKIQYNKSLLGDKFNKRLAVLLAAGVINLKTYIQISGINSDVLLNNAFGVDSSINKDKFVLKQSVFKMASDDIYDLYSLLIQYDLAEIFEDMLATDWFNSLAVSSSQIFQDPNSKKIPYIVDYTNNDIKSIIKLLKNNLTNDQLAISMKYFVDIMGIGLSDNNSHLWLEKSIEIFITFFDGTIRDLDVVFGFLTNDNSAELTRKIIEQNISKYQHIADINYADLLVFLSYPNPVKNRSSNTIKDSVKWIIDLHNKGDITFSTAAFNIIVINSAKVTSSVLPYIDIRNTNIFYELLMEIDNNVYSDYERGYFQWLIDKNSAIRQIIINMYITLNAKDIKSTYLPSIEFLRAEYTPDELIDNFKNNIWPNVAADYLFEEMIKYKHNKKLMDGLLEFINGVPKSDMNYDQYQVLLLSTSGAQKFNDIIQNIKAQNKDVAKEISRYTGFSIKNINKLFEEMTNNQDLIENIDSDVFDEIIKMADVIGDPIAIFEFGRKVKNYDEIKVDKAIGGLKNKKVKTELLGYLISADIGMAASKEIFRDDISIKPYQKLTETRIGEILKYNKIAPTKDQLIKISSIADINKLVIDFSKKIVDVKATPIKANEEYLERKTLEYDVFNKYRHGNIAPKIIREFDVHLDQQEQAFNEYVANNSWVDIIQPAFHGTGSVAASMILRYGFTIINSGDSSVKGRMIGDGIYFSTVLDKVSQYVADEGYSRNIGNKGYIFEMKAALGIKNKDYRSDGVDTNSFSLVSPEWVVFHPEKQLLIYKAFEVELVSKADITKLKQKHQIKESVVEIKTFKEYLRESTNTAYINATTYSFIDGTIPINKTNAVDFEQFDPMIFGQHVRLEGSQIGPMLTIEHNGPQSQGFCVRNTAEFMEQPELNAFLALLAGQVDI